MRKPAARKHCQAMLNHTDSGNARQAHPAISAPFVVFGEDALQQARN